MDLRAGDIMSEHVVIIHDDMLISQVAHLMLRDRVSSFPVVDGAGQIVGIVTVTDLFVLIQQAYQQTSSGFAQIICQVKDRKIGEVMSRQVITISPQTTVNEVVHLVVDKGIHCFPVMEGKKMVGIVSRHDILNAIFTCLSEDSL
jgi:CBS domain-containing protein